MGAPPAKSLRGPISGSSPTSSRRTTCCATRSGRLRSRRCCPMRRLDPQRRNPDCWSTHRWTEQRTEQASLDNQYDPCRSKALACRPAKCPCCPTPCSRTSTSLGSKCSPTWKSPNCNRRPSRWDSRSHPRAPCTRAWTQAAARRPAAAAAAAAAAEAKEQESTPPRSPDLDYCSTSSAASPPTVALQRLEASNRT